MVCTKCGSKMADGVKFCTVCGKPMDVEPSQNAASFFAPARDLDLVDYEPPVVQTEPVPEHTMPVTPISYNPVTPISYNPVTPIRTNPATTFPQKPNPQPVRQPAAVRSNSTMPSTMKISAAIVIAALLIGGIIGAVENRSSSKPNSGGYQGNGNYSSYNGYNYSNNNYSYSGGSRNKNSGSSRIDCPACTGGRHNLCHGSGKYSNYGETVDCPCNGGTCSLCGGKGYR